MNIKAIITILSISLILTQSVYSYNEYTKYNDKQYKLIALDVAKDHKYIENIYDCSEFSKELYHRLRMAGYNTAFISTGCKYNDKNESLCHAWVSLVIDNTIIDIESIHGDIIPTHKYYNKYPHKRRVFTQDNLHLLT